jgi:hypothetical protein
MEPVVGGDDCDADLRTSFNTSRMKIDSRTAQYVLTTHGHSLAMESRACFCNCEMSFVVTH